MDVMQKTLHSGRSFLLKQRGAPHQGHIWLIVGYEAHLTTANLHASGNKSSPARTGRFLHLQPRAIRWIVFWPIVHRFPALPPLCTLTGSLVPLLERKGHGCGNTSRIKLCNTNTPIDIEPNLLPSMQRPVNSGPDERENP
jgi:hypothetical protein